MITIPGADFQISGRALESRPTQHVDAWSLHPLTVELYQPLEAIRVAWHMNRVYGEWFAIGDVVHTRQQYAGMHALPGKFRFTGFFDFLPGTILNVGQCNPLFGKQGLGYQAEFLDGPLPRASVSRASWVYYAGNA